MNRRSALVTTSAVLLLAGMPMTTFASHGAAPQQRHSVVNQPKSMTTAMHYFKALQPHGRSSHDYQALAHLYDPGVALTESLSTGRPVFHTGLAQMRAFDKLNTFSWSVLSAKQLSPMVVVATERPFAFGPGHELEHGELWSTRLTISRGTITDLVWRPLSQSGDLHRRANAT